MMNFPTYFKTYQQQINACIDSVLTTTDASTAPLIESARYSSIDGGKRIRGVLAMKMGELLTPGKSMITLAAALEMIHTFSLIHDDLPSMDNDDYRRGKLSNHKVFGEDMAILTGDFLFIEAINVMIRGLSEEKFQQDRILAAVNYLLDCLGEKGMVGGQVIDIRNDNDSSEKQLEKMHLMKTGALLRASLVCPVLLAMGTPNLPDLDMETYADQLGLLFQIVDDILDETGDSEIMGKSAGSDRNQDKASYVTVLGLDQARKKADIIYNKLRETLASVNMENMKQFLADIIDIVYKREH